MNSPAATSSDPKTTTEAAGYIGGVFTAMLQAIMPLRMWILLAASGVLLMKVIQTESLLSIARMLSVYIVLVAMLVGSAVFQRK